MNFLFIILAIFTYYITTRKLEGLYWGSSNEGDTMLMKPALWLFFIVSIASIKIYPKIHELLFWCGLSIFVGLFSRMSASKVSFYVKKEDGSFIFSKPMKNIEDFYFVSEDQNLLMKLNVLTIEKISKKIGLSEKQRKILNEIIFRPWLTDEIKEDTTNEDLKKSYDAIIASYDKKISHLQIAYSDYKNHLNERLSALTSEHSEIFREYTDGFLTSDEYAHHSEGPLIEIKKIKEDLNKLSEELG